MLSNAELGKLVRNSAKVGRGSNFRNYNQQQQLAATRNLYNKQQPLQYAPTLHNRRQFGSSDSLNEYNPLSPAASNGGQSNANNDDDDNEGGNFGANFDNSDNDGEGGAQADGQAMNLNQAASGYPSQGDYSDGVGFNFGGSGGEGSDFGPSEGFGGDGRRAKSASSLMGSRNIGDDDAGAPIYGPNSAVNSGDDDEGRSGYAPEASNDNENDDE